MTHPELPAGQWYSRRQEQLSSASTKDIFLAAAKNATLKHWELWKVFGLTVQLGTNFVTFQNSKWMSLVKKHWTASGEKQDVFLQDLLKILWQDQSCCQSWNPALWQARERIALKACSRVCFYSAQIYRQIKRKKIDNSRSQKYYVVDKSTGHGWLLGFNEWFMDIVQL